jgi:2Fe-2S ferredoxin
MAKIFFKKINETFEVDISAGETLLDAAKKINISEITADCKGNCACGTCHIHIDHEWVDVIEPIYLASLEPYLLEKSKHYNEKLSRLCCQIEIKDTYDGLVVHLLEH